MGCNCSKSGTPQFPRRGSRPTLLTGQARPREPKRHERTEVRVSCHASEGSKWHLELVSVSNELKVKLQDPHFVATRCDLDGSGDLDLHELKQAARVYGMDSSGDHGRSLQQIMAGHSRISKESFADMFASSRSKGTIPHSLRGMALGQLQHLHTLFVQSGWLDAQCESFNRENAQAIENGKKFKQGSNLYTMDSYVVGPMTRLGLCVARQHDAQHSIAEAHQTSSFSELVNPYGLIVHVFVSHYWGHDFTSTVTALRLWAEQRMTSEKAALVESMEAMVFWICLFALNQHQKAEEVGENPRQGPFNAALAQARDGAVMVLDEDIRPFSRIWCLFEISRLKELRAPFELISTEGSLSKPVIVGSQAAKMLEAACEALWDVSILNAQSSVEADKFEIWAEAANEGVRPVIAGVGSMAEILEVLGAYDSSILKFVINKTFIEVIEDQGDNVSALQRSKSSPCLPRWVKPGEGPAQMDAHLRGTCRPCLFYTRKADGCRKGNDCSHCHFCTRTQLHSKTNRILAELSQSGEEKNGCKSCKGCKEPKSSRLTRWQWVAELGSRATDRGYPRGRVAGDACWQMILVMDTLARAYIRKGDSREGVTV
eukprot:Skav223638  [mRNA]  locus=scaffold46:319985:337811:+ [translate_table: standard]